MPSEYSDGVFPLRNITIKSIAKSCITAYAMSISLIFFSASDFELTLSFT